jgi:hypothetical protein
MSQVTWKAIEDIVLKRLADCSSDAWRVWLTARIYNGEQLNDGVMSDRDLNVIAATCGLSIEVTRTAAAELIDRKAWKQADAACVDPYHCAHNDSFEQRQVQRADWKGKNDARAKKNARRNDLQRARREATREAGNEAGLKPLMKPTEADPKLPSKRVQNTLTTPSKSIQPTTPSTRTHVLPHYINSTPTDTEHLTVNSTREPTNHGVGASENGKGNESVAAVSRWLDDRGKSDSASRKEAEKLIASYPPDVIVKALDKAERMGKVDGYPGKPILRYIQSNDDGEGSLLDREMTLWQKEERLMELITAPLPWEKKENAQ